MTGFLVTRGERAAGVTAYSSGCADCFLERASSGDGLDLSLCAWTSRLLHPRACSRPRKRRRRVPLEDACIQDYSAGFSLGYGADGAPPVSLRCRIAHIGGS